MSVWMRLACGKSVPSEAVAQGCAAAARPLGRQEYVCVLRSCVCKQLWSTSAATVPPHLALLCACAAVERAGSSAAPSPARLLVGSLHDNALLLCRSLALDSFTSPLVLLTRTRSKVVGNDAPVQVRGVCGAV
jgi:hypothetical protein